jgi:hypothetical protein
MPTIKISVPHKLGVDEAKKRISGLIAESRAQFSDQVSDVKETWAGNRGDFSFKAMGFSVSGFLQVEADKAEVQMNLPFAAMLFKDKIESRIRARAEELLA